MPTEDEIRSMLPLQQVTLARAALAGITYEKVTDEVRHVVNENGSKRGVWLQITKIRAKWPEGNYVTGVLAAARLFDDELEAAIYCLDWLDNPCIGEMTCQCYRCKDKDKLKGLFKVKP